MVKQKQKKDIKMKEETCTEVTLAVIQTDVTYIKEKMDALDTKMNNNYVSKEEFEPVKNIVYGLVGIILIAVIGALLALVVQGKN